MKVNIIVPFIPFRPGGGLRVMFEYANHLTSLGHAVTLYYPIRVAFIKQSYVKAVIKYILYNNKSSAIIDWFVFDDRIKIKCVFNITNKTIADGDIVFSTWWSLMFEIKKLSASKGKVFNLIQDIENWGGYDDEVTLSYRLINSNNLVIANYLSNYIYQVTGKLPFQIPFAIDNNTYRIKIPVEVRDKYTLCMMYSIEPRKGSEYGLNVFRELKLKYPLLRLILFSVANAPYKLPDWIEYYKNPSNLSDLYNRAAVFLSPSLQEGCALPPMEAMCCGCALVCTDIDGHKDYAFDGATAILAKPNDINNIVEKVSCLLENNDLRIKIATQGHKFMKNYTWSASTQKLESFFNSAINNACN